LTKCGSTYSVVALRGGLGAVRRLWPPSPAVHLRRRMHSLLNRDNAIHFTIGWGNSTAAILTVGGDVAPTPLKIVPRALGGARRLGGSRPALRGRSVGPATADRVRASAASGLDSAVALIGGIGVRGNRDFAAAAVMAVRRFASAVGIGFGFLSAWSTAWCGGVVVYICGGGWRIFFMINTGVFIFMNTYIYILSL
jgi:hypothetical protein